MDSTVRAGLSAGKTKFSLFPEFYDYIYTGPIPRQYNWGYKHLGGNRERFEKKGPDWYDWSMEEPQGSYCCGDDKIVGPLGGASILPPGECAAKNGELKRKKVDCF